MPAIGGLDTIMSDKSIWASAPGAPASLDPGGEASAADPWVSIF